LLRARPKKKSILCRLPICIQREFVHANAYMLGTKRHFYIGFDTDLSTGNKGETSDLKFSSVALFSFAPWRMLLRLFDLEVSFLVEGWFS